MIGSQVQVKIIFLKLAKCPLYIHSLFKKIFIKINLHSAKSLILKSFI